MFGNKKETKTEIASVAAVPSPNQDIIVHNMPKPSGLGGGFSESGKTRDEDFSATAISKKQNFKTVGFLIMGLGVIFIAALAYLSYRFIISPTAGKKTAAIAQPAEIIPKKAPAPAATVPSASVPTTTPIIAVTSTSSEAAAPTAATSSLMNEELSGQDGSNLPPLLDTDNDGLLDDEEVLLGTSATSTDSDGDKYGDLDELVKVYNPAGAGVLAGNANLVRYDNRTFNYNILYPQAWQIKALAADATVVFTAPDDSLVQISVQDNPDRAGILGWYQSAFPDTNATYDQLLSVNGWDGIIGTDNLNFYLTDSKHSNIYVISYIPAVAKRIAYPNIFKMIINSLVIK